MQLIPFEPSNEQTQARRLFLELCRRGDDLVEQDQFKQAEICYRQAAVVAPDEPAPFVALGVLAMQGERFDEAHLAFQAACDINPQCSEGFAGLAMLHHEQKNFGRAFEMYLKSLERNPDNLMALLGLFQTSCEMGTFATIIQYLEQYLQKHPGDHSVMFCLATLYAREGMLLQAKQALLAVLAAEPDKPEAQSLLNDVQTRLDQPVTEVA